MEKKAFCRKDLLIIIPVLIIAAIMFLGNYLQPPSAAVAIVEKNGTEFCRIDLQKQKSIQIINVGGPMNIKLKAEPGAISFYHSDCPDQICVRTGKISKPGQTAVCLPGKVSVRIVSRNASSGKAYDAFTG